MQKLGRQTATASGRAPVAYAILPHKTKPGLFFAVELREVSFKDAEVLEPSGSAERRGGCLARVETAVLERTMRNGDGWQTNYMRKGG